MKSFEENMFCKSDRKDTCSNNIFIEILNNQVGEFDINKIKYLRKDITLLLSSNNAFIYHNKIRKIIFKIPFNTISIYNDGISYKDFIFIMTENEFIIFDTSRLKITKIIPLKSIIEDYYEIYSVNLFINPFFKHNTKVEIRFFLEIQYSFGASKYILDGTLKLDLLSFNFETNIIYNINKQEMINNILVERKFIKYLPFIEVPSNRNSILKNELNEQILIDGLIIDISYNIDKDEYYLLVDRDYEVSLYILDNFSRIKRKIDNIYKIIDPNKMNIIEKVYKNLNEDEKFEASLFLEEKYNIKVKDKKGLEYVGKNTLILYSDSIIYHIDIQNDFKRVKKVNIYRDKDFKFFYLNNLTIIYCLRERKLIVCNNELDILNIFTTNIEIDNIFKISNNKIVLVLDSNKIQIIDIYDRHAINYSNSKLGSIEIEYIGNINEDIIFIIGKKEFSEGNRLYLYNHFKDELFDLGFIFVKQINKAETVKIDDNSVKILINNFIYLIVNIKDMKIQNRYEEEKEETEDIEEIQSINNNKIDIIVINDVNFLLVKQQNNNYIITSNNNLSDQILCDNIIGICEHFKLLPCDYIFKVKSLSSTKKVLEVI